MSGRVRWALVVLVLAVAAAVALWPRGGDSPAASRPAATTPAPDLAAIRSTAALRPCPQPQPAATAPTGVAGLRTSCLGDGGQLDVGAALAGRPTLVNLWATWCLPCKDELPVLEAYASQPGAIAVLGVAQQSRADDALGLLTRLGVRLPSVFDADGSVGRALHAPPSLPASFLVHADGTVQRITDPLLFTSAELVRQTVSKYLGAG
ncbi:TlpA family protein disulfide reductase [Solihabitans fulvus]|uniref:TlpA family protein disulfide reductase n=1 Tax=Solihabitans fulvus TaxID=1892852 RepID=A0A5B2XGM0_9PSEU|nr:TlpA disulfide reductase family protein [Solihabitans fulvus]KAA2262259.1 TlpA family protein disulfide reductase [Solihabitans fulvus]